MNSWSSFQGKPFTTALLSEFNFNFKINTKKKKWPSGGRFKKTEFFFLTLSFYK